MLTLQSRGAGAQAVVPALVAGLVLAACAPTTTYRHTGLVPAAHALPWDGRTASPGSLRIEGSAESVWVSENLLPVAHDTALNVANTMLEGSAALAVARGVEVGARLTYASYGWSTLSAAGTLPLPDHPSLWGVGPEMRVTVPLDPEERFAIGFAGNLLAYNVPYAEWQYAGACTPAPTCVDNYELVDERSETHLAFDIAVYPSLLLGRHGEAGHLFGGLSAHTGFKNDGFTDVASNGSTIQDAGLVFIWGLGYGVEVDGARFSAMIELPLSNSGSPVAYGLGAFFIVGTALRLLEPRPQRDDM